MPMARAGDGIVLCVLALLCVGVVMVNSALLSVGSNTPITFESIVLSRSSAYMVMAMLALLVVSRLPLDRLASSIRITRKIPLILPFLVVALAMVYLPGLGHEVNGAARWIKAPGTDLTMQPSELAKWGVVLMLAWHGASRAGVMHSFRKGLLPALIVLFMIVGIITKEDLGTGVLIMAAGSFVLIAAGARIWHFVMMAPIALAGIVLAVIVSPYRMTRLITFLDPYKNPDAEGYHMLQSLVAVANGKGFGRGLGFGLQKFGYLPEDHTDFLFAVICEELGIAGAALVIGLYVLMLWFGISIVRKQTNPFLKLTGIGVLTTVGLQAVMNLVVVTGLAPTKGIALPLLSSGGTGWILTAASLGLLVAMDRCLARTEPLPTLAGEPAGLEIKAPLAPALARATVSGTL